MYSLAGLGLLALVLGLLQAARLVSAIINESQGKCDYVTCVWPWTYPLLAASLAVAAVGAIVLTWTSLTARRL